MSALHTSVDVGLLSNQTAFIHLHAVSVLVYFLDTLRSTTSYKDHLTPLAFTPFQTGWPQFGDGRRPDGVTSFSFKGGKALAWDATCTDSFSTSNLYSIILNPGSASSVAEDMKRQKYSQLVADFEFVPLAVETSGIIG